MLENDEWTKEFGGYKYRTHGLKVYKPASFATHFQTINTINQNLVFSTTSFKCINDALSTALRYKTVLSPNGISGYK